jgi:hypothetical protein
MQCSENSEATDFEKGNKKNQPYSFIKFFVSILCLLLQRFISGKLPTLDMLRQFYFLQV